jgi:hypothetical protein
MSRAGSSPGPPSLTSQRGPEDRSGPPRAVGARDRGVSLPASSFDATPKTQSTKFGFNRAATMGHQSMSLA